MPTPGQELSSIDFESMLGGPLIAVVHAQAQAAMSTVNFIKEVGFKKPPEEEAGGDTTTQDPIYVTFKYPKELVPYQPAIAAVAAECLSDGTSTRSGREAVSRPPMLRPSEIWKSSPMKRRCLSVDLQALVNSVGKFTKPPDAF